MSKLTEAKELFAEIESEDAHNRAQYLESTRFYNGEQWPEGLKRARENNPDGARPCLTANVLPQYVKQVTNEMRMNRPSIKVLPMDSGADVETAKVFQGLVRAIEVNSDADVVYSTGGRTGVIGGFGYWRVVTEYVDQEYNYQEICLRRIANPLTVYFGSCECPAGSDVEDVFVTTLIPRKKFARLYPKASTADFDGGGDDWNTRDDVRIAEWFHVNTKKTKAVVLPDGRKVPRKEFERLTSAGMIDPSYATDEAELESRTIEWRKLSGDKILEERDFLGRYIPVVRYVGQEVNIEGKWHRYGLVRDAMDPQRMRNYWRSCETEMIALAPKAPFIGAVGAFDGVEAQWAAANVSNRAYLEYNNMDAAGNQIPTPQRQPATPIPTAIMQAAQNADQDMKATMGIYGASLGMKSNETSGKAILARQREGDTSTYDYIDNLSVSVRHTGRILVDLIPRIYDSARVVRILGEGDETQSVQLNPDMDGPPEKTPGMKGIEGIYNLNAGKYDVAVAVGPSFTTRRMEAAESMAQMLSTNPGLWQVAGDLFARTLDWPGAEQLAERLKKTIPPELMEKDAGTTQMGQALQQSGQALQQAKQMIEELQQQLRQADAQSKALQTAEAEIDQDKIKIDAYKATTERMKLFAEHPESLPVLNALGMLGEGATEPPMIDSMEPMEQFEQMPQEMPPMGQMEQMPPMDQMQPNGPEQSDFTNS